MSHLAKVKTKVTDFSLFCDLAKSMGFETYEGTHVHKYSKTSVVGTIVTDQKGMVKVAVSEDGSIYHDSFYMGHEADRLMQQYSSEMLGHAARQYGGWVESSVTDDKGNLVLTIQEV